jgi:hypothetical protein
LEDARAVGSANARASGEKIGKQKNNRNRSAKVRKRNSVLRQEPNLSANPDTNNDAPNICKKLKINNNKNQPETRRESVTYKSTSNGDHTSTTKTGNRNKISIETSTGTIQGTDGMTRPPTQCGTSTSNGNHTSNKNNNNSNSNKNNNNKNNNNKNNNNRRQERKRQRRKDDMRATRATKVPINEGIHGNRLKPKEYGFTRVAVENFNSLGVGAKAGRNNEYAKVTKLKRLVRQLDLDILGGSEVRANWSVLGEAKSLSNTFRSETEFRSVTGHNTHEEFGTTQEGGTCVMTFDQVATKVASTATDPTGLGRWCSILFKGKNNHTSRVISAYQPVKQPKQGHFSSVYAQHRRYFRSNHEFRCPRVLFVEHMLEYISKCQENGEKIILLMDANECLETGKLSKALTALGLHDAIKTRTGLPGPPTFAYGQRQIDGIWISDALRASSGSFLPLYVGIGDHRIPIIDIPNDMLFGEPLHQVTRSAARRLQNKLPDCAAKYRKNLRKYCRKHRIVQRLQDIYQEQSVPLSLELQQKLETLDKQCTEGMRYAERTCRKLRMGELDFSPALNIAKERVLLWRLIIKKKLGGRVSSMMLRRKAKYASVSSPLSGTLFEAQHALDEATRIYNLMRPEHERLRDEFLSGQLKQAISDEDIRKQRIIRRLIAVQDIKSQWRAIKRAVGKKNGGSVKEIEVAVNGENVICSNEKEVVEAITENNVARFNLTIHTPLMQNTMTTLLGYMANTTTAEQILDGTFVPPDDLDFHTRGMLALLQQPTETDLPLINTTITKEDFQNYWKKANEKISSSWSQLHFGHYIAASEDDFLSEIHALKTHLACSTGYSFPRWKKGLTVMLEKKAGVILVDKLRAILLMEADFNFANKLQFGCRLVKEATKRGRIHRNADGSRKHRQAIETSLNTKLVCDIHRQKRLPGANASVDASQCYDRMVHSFVSLMCQSIGMPRATIISMLTTIQEMQFHLRTAYGDSQSHYGGKQQIPFQGTCQGNGAGPAIWLVVVSGILQHLETEGHGLDFQSAITAAATKIIAFCYVDDTSLVVSAKNHNEDVISMIHRLQVAINCWSGGLSTTGGALKQIKCFWSVYYFIWKNGEPEYATIEDAPELQLTIPVHNGPPAVIERVDVHEANEMLGLWQSVSGNM